MKKTIGIIATAGLLMACSQAPVEIAPVEKASIQEPTPLTIEQQLRAQATHWKGVPYRLGGNNNQGIDCSALMVKVFDDVFNYALPRTSELQADIGQEVSRQQLLPGDLVLFKTSSLQRHIGVYIGKEEFLHASTRQGVIISSLENSYWAENYWMAKRLPLSPASPIQSPTVK
ncbi:MAG: C40 family peptidase [Pseudomonadales bacterium]|nr:C40 family peptidase [Pseudomonadales bacterium]